MKRPISFVHYQNRRWYIHQFTFTLQGAYFQYASFSPDIVLAKELHAHHSEDEDDDAEDEGEVGEGAHRVHHDRQDVVQRLPGLRQLEHPVEDDDSVDEFLIINRLLA